MTIEWFIPNITAVGSRTGAKSAGIMGYFDFGLANLGHFFGRGILFVIWRHLLEPSKSKLELFNEIRVVGCPYNSCWVPHWSRKHLFGLFLIFLVKMGHFYCGQRATL